MSCFALRLPLASRGAAGTFLPNLPPPVTFVVVRAAGGHLLGHFWGTCARCISAALPERGTAREAPAAWSRVGHRRTKPKSRLPAPLPPGPRWLTGGTFVPLGRCKQADLGTWQKERTLGFFCLSLQTNFSFCSVKRLTLWHKSAHRIAVVLLPGLSVLCIWCKKNPFFPHPSTPGFQPGPGYCCCAHKCPHPHSYSCSMCFLVGLFSFVVVFLFFPKAFQIAPLKVTLKMSLVKMKGKFHLTFFPFDISIGLGVFVLNFQLPDTSRVLIDCWAVITKRSLPCKR